MNGYGTVLHWIHRDLRHYERLINDVNYHAYELDKAERKKLIPFWEECVADQRKQIEDLRWVTQMRMQNRPLWKKLLRKV